MNPANFASRFLRRIVADRIVVITGGPAAERIDAMRILTNRSTGELAIRLANALAENGVYVYAWIGAGANSQHARSEDVRWAAFETNADLLDQLERFSGRGFSVSAVFHAAALSDFRVAGIEDAAGTPLDDAKLSSRQEGIRLLLKPAPKVLPHLRRLFPVAYLCGWKFEAGGALDARLAAKRQLRECNGDACVLNGPAVDNRFEWTGRDGSFAMARDRVELVELIADAFTSGGCIGPSEQG